MQKPKVPYWQRTAELTERVEEITADTTTLAEAVRSTFFLSMHGAVPLERRAILNALGGRLRDQLRALLGELFDAGTPELVSANAKIKEVNTQLNEAKERLDRVADTIEGLGKLAASLDKLLSIVGVVV